jgi:hypothetical protein
MGQHAIRNTIAVYVNISVFSNVNEELLGLHCQLNNIKYNKINEKTSENTGNNNYVDLKLSY